MKPYLNKTVAFNPDALECAQKILGYKISKLR